MGGLWGGGQVAPRVVLFTSARRRRVGAQLVMARADNVMKAPKVRASVAMTVNVRKSGAAMELRMRAVVGAGSGRVVRLAR